MPTPAPFHDPGHIETRLLVVAEMLERAVAEVRRAMEEIKSVTPPRGVRPFPPFVAAQPEKEDDET